LILFSLSI